MTSRGLIIAAPASGSGKTLVTLALLRALTARGISVASAKVGPDYIDPAFHAAASGRPCVNLDAWAMRPATVAGLARELMDAADLVVCEGVMGLFDGATADSGSTADIAALTGWPVLLVVDVRAQAASAAAVVKGFAEFRADVRVVGVLFNRIGSARHAEMLREACARALPSLAVVGCLPRADTLALPERHLGLVQAREHPALPAFLEEAAAHLARHVDLEQVLALAEPACLRAFAAPSSTAIPPPVPPLGRRIAIADDDAFAFRYPHVLGGWRRAGAELAPFSPLADEAPAADCDAVYLSGGYPELHAGRLAGNRQFLDGLRAAAARGATVFGECGGYMVLGDTLIDGEGRAHVLAGLLPLTTSFAERRLHLGYREATLATATPFAAAGTRVRGHEFHYARLVKEAGAAPLFRCRDAGGQDLGTMGLTKGSVCGSFVHVVDFWADAV